MRARLTLLLLVAVAPCLPATAAAYLRYSEVAQPMVNLDGDRLEIHRVTYGLKLEAPMPGLEIQLTCHPGPVVMRGEDRGDSVSTSDVTNQNIANLLGISIKVEHRPESTWSAEPDTAAAREGRAPASRPVVRDFRVELDVSGLAKRIAKVHNDEARRKQLRQFDALVAAIVECVRENARRSEPAIRNIHFEVSGWDRFKRHNQNMQVGAPVETKLFGY